MTTENQPVMTHPHRTFLHTHKCGRLIRKEDCPDYKCTIEEIWIGERGHITNEMEEQVFEAIKGLVVGYYSGQDEFIVMALEHYMDWLLGRIDEKQMVELRLICARSTEFFDSGSLPELESWVEETLGVLQER